MAAGPSTDSRRACRVGGSRSTPIRATSSRTSPQTSAVCFASTATHSASAGPSPTTATSPCRTGTASRRWTSSSARSADRESRVPPGLEAAGQVRGAMEPKLAEVRGGEARLVTAVAHDDEPGVRFAEPWVAVLAVGRAAPLEDVAGHDDRAGHGSVARDLRLRADVDEDGARAHLVLRVRRLDAVDDRAGACEEGVDRAHPRTAASNAW